MHRPRVKQRINRTPFVATAVVGAVGFAALSSTVAARRTRSFDQSLRKKIGTRHGKTSKRVVAALGYSGKTWVHGPAAALLSTYVKHRGSLEGSRAINLAGTLAESACKTFDWVLRHRAPPPGRHAPREQSFPSGHTLETAAIAITAAHVLWREGMAGARIGFPIAAAIPILEGAGRLYLDRHWATDVAAGLLGGVTIAAICILGYEHKVQPHDYW
ncbi:MAG: phosphatase PAP2 family protein [Gemmatimonadota bacterium]|nr:phosphatase PAP2 family protein [Gemmatimonadota bacterium]